MLYVTTRDNTDAFTYPRTLMQDTAADGGYYAPFHLPDVEENLIPSLKKNSFAKNVAQTLNVFFTTGISGWDVECSIGRNAITFVPVNHKVIMMENCNNPGGNYQYFVKELFSKLCPQAEKPSVWAKTALRICALFGLFGQLYADEKIKPEECVDIAVNGNDFTQILACRYAKQMGLPIGNIICGSTENTSLWDLVHRGELATKNLTDAVSGELEQLLHCAFGNRVVSRYCYCREQGIPFALTKEEIPVFCNGFFVSVISKNRLQPVVDSIQKTSQYAVSQNTALCFAALQDFRSRTGESRLTLICVDDLP